MATSAPATLGVCARVRGAVVLITIALWAIMQSGCGDPLVVLGDAPGYLRVIAGAGDSIGTRVDSLAMRTRFTEPGAVVFDPATRLLYIADRGSTTTSGGITTSVTRIFAVTSAGRLQLLLDTGGCSSGTCLVEATAMTLAPDGGLLIADGVGHRVFRFIPATRQLEVVAGIGTPAYAPDGVPARQASLRRPAGIAVSPAGIIYISEENGHQVRTLDAAGVLGTLAGNGTASHSGDGGSAATAGVHSPAGLALHGNSLFLAEAGANAVRRVDLASHQIATVAGNLVRGFTGDGGPALQAALAAPRALAVTPDGTRLFIADRDNRRVRVVNLESGSIATYAGDGSTDFTGNRQPAGVTALRAPSGLWTSPGYLYIADPAMYVVWQATTDL